MLELPPAIPPSDTAANLYNSVSILQRIKEKFSERAWSAGFIVETDSCKGWVRRLAPRPTSSEPYKERNRLRQKRAPMDARSLMPLPHASAFEGG
jgi:hypothetical protein